MTLYVAALLLLVAGGLAALATSARPRLALAIGAGSAAAGSALGLAASAVALRAPAAALELAWQVPNGALALGLDPLSALFGATVFAVGLAASIFEAGYLRPQLGRRSLGPALLFWNVLLAAMGLLVAARQALLFLVAWEVMTFASFLLVAYEHEDARVRRAARTYLVASQLGTAALLGLFLVLGAGAGSLRFDAFAAARAAPAIPAAALFGLALVGFGTKAGLVPLHVWLPEAHPAAPSHVSALMSAVLVKMGIYGLLRALTFLPPAPAWHGLVLAGVGLGGALVALALALGQRDLKAVLAYSTVENLGLVSFGVGVALVGAALGAPVVAALAMAGALLHVWNHALMKGLAFLAVGALAHGAGTRDLERMGGLLRRLPATGGLLLLAAAALAGLPPLNGFLSEWLLYLGLLRGGAAAPGGLALVAWLTVATLAFVGGLAAVVFTRLVGIALLGAPRSAGAEAAHEGGPLLVLPLALLGIANVAVAVFPAETLALVAPAAALVLGVPAADLHAALAPAAATLAGPLRLGAAALVAAGALLAVGRRGLLARRDVRTSSTWGCGFAGESARVQYTAASYAQLPLVAAVPGALRPRRLGALPLAATGSERKEGHGGFPAPSRFALESDDPARARVFEPAFRRVGDTFARLRRFQQARLNLQLLYTVVTVLVLSAVLLLHRGSR